MIHKRSKSSLTGAKVPVLSEVVFQRFGPGSSSVVLQVRQNQWKVFIYDYEVKLKNFFVRGGSARNLEETEGASPGAPVARFPRRARASLME